MLLLAGSPETLQQFHKNYLLQKLYAVRHDIKHCLLRILDLETHGFEKTWTPQQRPVFESDRNYSRSLTLAIAVKLSTVMGRKNNFFFFSIVIL